MAPAPETTGPEAWTRLERWPRVRLAEFPTPFSPLRRLGRELGLDLWCKRDDLIGFGFGGNKVRGLEFLLADALAQGADTLVTGAGPQSNHVRATAAAAARHDLRCVAVFWGDQPPRVDGNYRLTRMLGAEPVFTGDAERSSVDAGIDAVCAALRAAGRRPYAIPRGGAAALGVFGHILAVKELHGQCAARGLAPETILMATGSGGTQAGWLLGTRLLGADWRIESFTVSREAEAARAQVARLAGEAAALLGWAWEFTPEEVQVHGGFIGAGYGIPSPEAAATIREVARLEGLLLDPTYTGKAMAGVLEHHRRGQASWRGAVFIHTGGAPAFFAGEGDWLDAPCR